MFNSKMKEYKYEGLCNHISDKIENQIVFIKQCEKIIKESQNYKLTEKGKQRLRDAKIEFYMCYITLCTYWDLVEPLHGITDHFNLYRCIEEYKEDYIKYAKELGMYE